MGVAFDDLWDYGDPAATELRLQAHRPGDDDPALVVEWLSQLARTHSLGGNFEEAHRLLNEAEAIHASSEPVPRARILLERGRSWNSAGERDKAHALFSQAWETARSAPDAPGADFHAVDAGHMLAIASEGDTVMEWNERALAAAEASNDPLTRRWIGSLCNNIGWAHHDAGDFTLALTCFERALEARVRYGRVSEIPIARWCVARCLRSLGRVNDALEIQQELAKNEDPTGFVDEELGECLHALGRADAARPHFARAHARLAEDPWMVENEAERMQRLKTLSNGRS